MIGKGNKMKRSTWALLTLVVVFSLISCSLDEKKGASTGEVAAVAQGQPDWAATTRVRSVVFFGQKEACPCTRKRIDDSWEVVSSVLGQGEGVEVKRLQLDVDGEEYDRFDDLRPVMVPPGIYFLDAEGKLVEMLQGEVDEVQVVGALMK